MRKTLIIQNYEIAEPGLILDVLKNKKISYDLVSYFKDDRLPPLANYQALMVLGGPSSANDQTESMRKQLKTVQKAIKNGLPYFGICLGLQVGVKACGGRVKFLECGKEFGFRNRQGNFYKILRTKSEENPLLKNIEEDFPIFELHRETVIPTQHMSTIGKGTECENQIVQIHKKAFGVQFHPELSETLFKKWMDWDWQLKVYRSTVQKDYKKLRDRYENAGKRLIENFLNIAEL